MTARRWATCCPNCMESEGHRPDCLLAIRERTRLPREKTPRKSAHAVALEERERYDCDLLDLAGWEESA